MTMDPDPDDLFAQITEGLELEVPTDITDWDALPDIEVVQRFNANREALLALGETLNPTTDKGFELHQERYPLIQQMRKRKLI